MAITTGKWGKGKKTIGGFTRDIDPKTGKVTSYRPWGRRYAEPEPEPIKKKEIPKIEEVKGLEKAERIKKGKGVLTDKERLELAQSRAKPGEEPTGIDPRTGQFIYPPEVTARTEAWEAGLASQAELEAAGVFEEVTPGEVPLAPAREAGAKVPLVGPPVLAITNILGAALKKGWLPKLKDSDIPITEETVRETALIEIRDNAQKEGISLSEGFGTLVESIPIAGGLISKYAGGLTETPSANAANVIDEINKIKEAASTGQEKVRNGLEDPAYGLDRARQMEEDVARLEGRLKALINSSPILIANTDEVNRIQEGILEAREKIARYRQASSFGLTAQLTGTGRITPTDEQMYYALQGYKEST